MVYMHELSITARLVQDPARLPLEHSNIAHGEAPGPKGETQRFHLGISPEGDRLYLFRSGHLPQEILVNELVAEWLSAANSIREWDIVGDPDPADIVRGGPSEKA